jgi:hypothetical protein
LEPGFAAFINVTVGTSATTGFGGRMTNRNTAIAVVSDAIVQ